MIPIAKIADNLELSQDNVIPHGRWTAKVSLKALEETETKKHGKLILVTAMTPTPHGEGKTVSSIGLAMALERLGHRSVVCLRQPSLGPVFGVKGGAAGGGKSTVEPMQEINLGLTGDIERIGSAHNLLAAMIDNHLYHGNELNIHPGTISWERVVDMNDRALRQIIVGLGKSKNGVPRETGFMISAASEVMAVLSLSKNYRDLRQSLGRIIVGYTRTGKAVRASDLKAAGAMAAILRDALQPNLVQTAEGTPALVHGGCFGNIAHGTTSLVSIMLARQLADYCIVEAGFGSDLGGEKFVDIAARAGGFDIDGAVLVASVRAIKYHSGISEEERISDSSHGIRLGLENLAKHIQNVKEFGLTPVVALNKFSTDSAEELNAVKDFCKTQGVPYSVSSAFEAGSLGAIDLAERVQEVASEGEKASPIYALDWSLEEKLNAIVRKIYGGDKVTFSDEARRETKRITLLELDEEPVCVAKTPLSLSDDPGKLGRPHGFESKVRTVEPAAGAGFNLVYMGDILTMPGLPKKPAAETIDLTTDGEIVGVQ